MTTQRGNLQTVSVTKTFSVFQKTLQPQTVLELSNLDRQCPLHMYLVLFYNQPLCSKYSNLNSVFSTLKAGLEETLDAYYPAAGRLRLDQSDGKLNLWCNNGGAILVEAVTQVRISELEDLSVYNEFFEKLVYKPVFNGKISEMPLLVAQVTKFGCGGYSIGTGASHSLFDGPSAYDFLTSWASNSAIFKGKKSCELQKPVHERGQLLKAVQSPLSGRRALAIDHLYQMIGQASGDGSFESNRESYVLKTFRLTGAMIRALKKKVSGENVSFSCSSFDVLSAHLWKARTKALAVSKEKTVCLQFAVDVRKKMKNPLPKGFSGNAYVLASVALPVKQLEGETLEAIVDMIRKAKNTIDNDYVSAYNQGLDQAPQFPSSSSSSSSSLPPLKELTVVSDWTRMPFHKIEFFRGGAAYASPLMPPIPEVAYFLQNPNDELGFDVRIGLLPEVIPDFSTFFLTNMQ